MKMTFKEKYLKLTEGIGRQLLEADFVGKTDEQVMCEYVTDIIMDIKNRGEYDAVNISVTEASNVVAREACQYFGNLELFSPFKQVAAELFREHCLN